MTPAAAYSVLIVPQDTRPYIYRTRDGGTTWQRITTGLPDTAIARVVRADPGRKGLLFCGTELGVFVSFDDGDQWQPLQLNLPVSSMRDMVVQGNDLVLATYGRSLWILDNITPLRQIAARAAEAEAHLFAPADVRAGALGRERRYAAAGRNADGREPARRRDHRLPAEGPAGPARCASRSRTRAAISCAPIPRWLRPRRRCSPTCPATGSHLPPVLTTQAGMNRFVWNLRTENPKVLPFALLGRDADVRRVHAGGSRDPRPDAARSAGRRARAARAGTPLS